MNAISLETTNDKFLISVDKTTLDEKFVVELIEHLRMEQLAQKINFSEDIEVLGEEIKSGWWQKNKSRLLGHE